jgi:DnaJ-class molecular chaperone
MDRELCRGCGGSGGWDSSRDCESYDEWNVCPECGGDGLDHGDVFIPERDAFTPND